MVFYVFMQFFRKAKILQTEKKKRECEKKALNLVIELIDGGLEEEVLLDKVCVYTTLTLSVYKAFIGFQFHLSLRYNN